VNRTPAGLVGRGAVRERVRARLQHETHLSRGGGGTRAAHRRARHQEFG
jgi:hypothetical protein